MQQEGVTTLSYHQYVQYFEDFIGQRFHGFARTKMSTTDQTWSSSEFCTHFKSYFPDKNLVETDCFLLTLTLIPHLDPAYYDNVMVELLGEGNAPQLGGVRGIQHRGILPTGEMALFLISGNDPMQRIALQQKYLSSAYWLFSEKVLSLEPTPPGEPRLSGKLILAEEYVDLLLTGRLGKPTFGIDFPAQQIATRQEWSDLVLNPHTRQYLQSLQNWLTFGKRLLNEWDMSRKYKPGYRVLFYGPPGTGKTLAATLLGKYTGRDVYRIDLSMVISKYIGETEKNLSKLFDKAEYKDWILFFDEADALFGKRTGVRDSHDRYANQEISYLLQRIENYDGLVILASNLKENIDDAFLRRFQAIIHFPMPRPGERLELWQKAVPDAVKLDSSVNLKMLADQYELSGADIMNVMHFCCLEAMATSSPLLSQDGLLKGIKRELQKLGKSG